ncbi:unnamed protein product [Euphydryas editha]|uniref:Reverse transcriptase RNase H-like domain-containing protein n=1 Tax=Euphydryas editha TaxID=104508 RepID=A0AAU9V4X3_EUPED|nr:unnamed protein product [Euphydryas editha]
MSKDNRNEKKNIKTVAINFNEHIETEEFENASLEGIGAILKQTQLDGKDKPVAYFSKKLNESQKRKKAIYLECFAIKEAVKYWQHWLIGKQFTIYSDHKPLENMNIKCRTDEELGDLTYYLSQYDFTVKYIPGKENVEADCLSRNPVLEPEDNKEELLKIVNLIQIKDIVEDQEKNENIIEKKHNLIQKNKIYYKKIKKHEKIILSEEFSKKLIKKVHTYLRQRPMLLKRGNEVQFAIVLTVLGTAGSLTRGYPYDVFLYFNLITDTYQVKSLYLTN